MANLYNKAGLVNIPIGYSDGFLYNIKPVDDTLAFRFNRDSAATRVNKEGLIEQVGYFGPELVQNGDFSELGPELVTNGNFDTNSDWNLVGSNVSISNNKLNFVNVTSNSEFAQQAIVAPIGKTYKITLEVSNLGSGESIKIRFPFQDTTINTNGFHAIYGVGDQANFFRITPNSATATFSIDNVSVKQVDPNDYWTVGSSWSFGDNKIIGGGTGIFRPTTNSWTSGGKFLFKLKISDRTSGYIRIQNPAVTVYYVNNIDENGELEFIFDSIDNTGWAIEAQGGFNGSITDISVTEILGDKPRIDYTDSLTSPSFLLEPQRTNLVTYSEDFSQWASGGVTITPNSAISPDGTQNASLFSHSGGSFPQIALQGITFVSSADYAPSLYVKSDGTTQVQHSLIVNGQVVNFTPTNEWVRVSDLIVSPDTSGSFVIAQNSGSAVSASFYIWGAQLEEGSYATSYIPTAGSTVTRAEETCIGAGNASTFNDSEGVLYAEIAALANDGTNRAIAISDGTTSNVVRFYYSVTDNIIVGNIRSSGLTVFSYNNVLTDVTDFIKVAVSYKANDFKMYVDGVQVSTDTSGAVPTGIVELNLDIGSGVYNFYGKVKGVYVFNEALTDDELQQLTGPEYNSFAALAAAYNYTVI